MRQCRAVHTDVQTWLCLGDGAVRHAVKPWGWCECVLMPRACVRDGGQGEARGGEAAVA